MTLEPEVVRSFEQNFEMALTHTKLDQFVRDGLVVIEDFLTQDEVKTLRESCLKLVREMDPKEHHGVFSTTSHNQVCKSYRPLYETLVLGSCRRRIPC